MAVSVAIAGSTRIGSYCLIGGGAATMAEKSIYAFKEAAERAEKRARLAPVHPRRAPPHRRPRSGRAILPPSRSQATRVAPSRAGERERHPFGISSHVEHDSGIRVCSQQEMPS